MIARFILTAFLIPTALFLSSEKSHACSCFYVGGFSEYSKEQTVVRAKIESYGPKLSHGETFYETMTVSIDRLIQGSFRHPTIEFIGDPGHLCLTYVNSDAYPLGSEHLFTVISKDKKQGLGGCGEVSVLIDGNKIKGTKLDDTGDQLIKYSEDYDEFIHALTGPKTLTGQKLKPKLEPKPWWKFW